MNQDPTTPSSVRVLLVEDNPADARLLVELLRDGTFGTYEVDCIERLGDVEEHLAQSPDVVLLDLNLPDSIGFETIENLPETVSSLPVIVLTGLTNTDAAFEVLGTGIQDFLVKGSFDTALLERTIRYAIERKRHEVELAEARDHALEASRLKSAFLANVSHEIRTPLNIIVGFAGMIAEELEEVGSDVAGEFLPPLKRASRRLIQMVGGILDIARIESGTYQVRPKVVDLRELLRQVVDDHRPTAEGKGLELLFEAPSGIDARVLVDETCIRGALTNLLDNAVKFTSEGQVQAVLTACGPEAEGSFEIAIIDTGVGFDATLHEQIFEAFQQLDPSATREYEGLGLGLALVRTYLTLNDAKVGCTSVLGEGASFTVQFPRALAEAARVQADQQVEDESSRFAAGVPPLRRTS